MRRASARHSKNALVEKIRARMSRSVPEAPLIPAWGQNINPDPETQIYSECQCINSRHLRPRADC